jgi:hypothetical protein
MAESLGHQSSGRCVVPAVPLVYLPQEFYPSSGSMHFWKIPDTLRLYNLLLMIVYAPARR